MAVPTQSIPKCATHHHGPSIQSTCFSILRRQTVCRYEAGISLVRLLEGGQQARTTLSGDLITEKVLRIKYLLRLGKRGVICVED